MSSNLNVDPQEIAKFEALASRWWDRSGEFKPLHDINPLRANYIDQHSPVAGLRLVDVGCGGGILAEAMVQRGATVTGIDMGEAPLSVAKLHQLESGLEVDYRQCTAEQLAAYIGRRLFSDFQQRFGAGCVSSIRVAVSETAGQAGVYHFEAE